MRMIGSSILELEEQEEGVENWVEKKGKVFGVKNWRRGLYPTMGPAE